MRRTAARQFSQAFFKKIKTPGPGEEILVAVSGGVDSMVLLHVLHALSVTQDWKLTVAHFNHCLRGKASDADEAFVRRAAARMGLPFVPGRGEVRKFAKESKLSVEMAARKLRHEFFAQMARRRKIETVALAHHADDQVELFFLRLLRGAGTTGLAGMKWKSTSPADKSVCLVRPLLDCSKMELEQFASENKIRYREDATNRSRDFLRNRIRLELLPLLRNKYEPALSKTILRVMETARAESEFVVEIAQAWLRNKTWNLPAKGNFEKLPVAIQRQVLKLQLADLGVAVDFDLIESLRLFPNKTVSVTANVSLSRDRNGRVVTHGSRAIGFDKKRLTVNLALPGDAIFDGTNVCWQFKVKPASRKRLSRFRPEPGTEYFDASRMGRNVILRHWRAGDRFRPIGLESAAKLQDLFINKKIPRAQRHRLMIAETNHEIFWVEGLRISENFKLTPQTKRILVWRWSREKISG